MATIVRVPTIIYPIFLIEIKKITYDPFFSIVFPFYIAPQLLDNYAIDNLWFVS